MAELVKAIGDFVAALLSVIGFVGAPRRRAEIVADLDLLKKLGDYPEFGPGTDPHRWLSDHLALRIGEFSGLDFRTSRRAIQWNSVVIVTFIWAPLGWLTYHLVDIGHPWYATIPGTFAAFFFLATLGMLGRKEEVVPSAESASVSTHQLIGSPTG